MSDRESRVRTRAHELWEQEGRPDGREFDHWERASREIDAEDGNPAARKKATSKRAPSAASGGGSKPARKARSAK